MVKTNRFGGFEFSFIQIARLLKKIFPLRRRLVWKDLPYNGRTRSNFGKRTPFLISDPFTSMLQRPIPHSAPHVFATCMVK
jgi:hypothetical protein